MSTSPFRARKRSSSSPSSSAANRIAPAGAQRLGLVDVADPGAARLAVAQRLAQRVGQEAAGDHHVVDPVAGAASRPCRRGTAGRPAAGPASARSRSAAAAGCPRRRPGSAPARLSRPVRAAPSPARPMPSYAKPAARSALGVEEVAAVDDQRPRHPRAPPRAQSSSANSGHSVTSTAASAPSSASSAESRDLDRGSSSRARSSATGS